MEAALWAAGVLLLLAFGGLRLWYEAQRSLGIKAFEYSQLQRSAGSAQAQLRSPASPRPIHTTSAAQSFTPNAHRILRFSPPHTADWSVGRLAKYLASASGGTPEAVMKITRLRLEVPIYSGVSELNLNRGAARLLNTSTWDTPGNTAVAAHRDGYFRALQGIALGDEIMVETGSSLGTLHYQVEQIRVVNPSDVEVLAPTSSAWLTLITCYPFHYVGSAPKRFIVKARRIEAVTVVESDEDHKLPLDRVT
ncbi:MAG TPA: class D sortase [Steroidobacteraceae bacterium]|nr:class D sortase [Steroidobacteraceae bacterium]